MQYLLTIEYDGTDFSGWQIQPNARTVQATLEAALSVFLGHPARATAAGRTDAGVHAAGQAVCFRTPRELSPEIALRALNALTPDDLGIRTMHAVADDFDARRSARSRTYRYYLWNRRSRSPFWRRYAWHISRPLAIESMATAATLLRGEHDFSSFRAAGCDAAHPTRRVSRSEVRRQGDLVCYEIEATAFLRHMVRNIVGTLVEVGRGRRAPEEVVTLLAMRDRTKAGATAPAHGLCLWRVDY